MINYTLPKRAKQNETIVYEVEWDSFKFCSKFETFKPGFGQVLMPELSCCGFVNWDSGKANLEWITKTGKVRVAWDNFKIVTANFSF